MFFEAEGVGESRGEGRSLSAEAVANAEPARRSFRRRQEITRRLREAGEMMGVRVLDHVIVGKGRFVSFVDDGYW